MSDDGTVWRKAGGVWTNTGIDLTGDPGSKLHSAARWPPGRSLPRALGNVDDVYLASRRPLVAEDGRRDLDAARRPDGPRRLEHLHRLRRAAGSAGQGRRRLRARRRHRLAQGRRRVDPDRRRPHRQAGFKALQRRGGRRGEAPRGHRLRRRLLPRRRRPLLGEDGRRNLDPSGRPDRTRWLEHLHRLRRAGGRAGQGRRRLRARRRHRLAQGWRRLDPDRRRPHRQAGFKALQRRGGRRGEASPRAPAPSTTSSSPPTAASGRRRLPRPGRCAAT